MRLEGKTALITGGSSGIGFATARLFVSEGARVAITGRDEVSLDKARGELGPAAVAVRSDVRSLSDLTTAAEQVRDAFGGLDIFFPNAGIAPRATVDSAAEDLYDEVMDTNVKGVFFAVQAVLPIMRDGGAIVLNTSFLNQVGRPGTSLVSAAKAAVRSFAMTWSSELLERRIRVNAVSPGAIDTPLLHRGRTPEQVESVKAIMTARIPAGRLGAADDIAHAVLYLASDESRYVLGEELIVDGGASRLQV